MVNESSLFGLTSQGQKQISILDYVCYALFCLVIIGLSPFSPVSQDTVLVEAGSNALRQGIILVCLAICLFSCIRKPSLLDAKNVPVVLLALFTLAILSSTWAIDSNVSLKRSLSLVLYSCAFLYSFRAIELKRTLLILTIITLSVVCIDCVSVAFVDTARHLNDEADKNLVGAWRGMHNHKNRAGVVAVLCILLCLYQARARREWPWYLGSAIGLFFLAMTKSKTSGIIIGIVVLVYLLVAISSKTWTKGEKFLVVGMALVFGIVGFVASWDGLVERLNDPTAFTGRVKIWRILVSYALDHPLSGSGFGSFWQIGEKGPALKYSAGWEALAAPHGHNGYLDMAASLGLPGFFGAILVVVILPIFRATQVKIQPERRALAVALVVFTILHNFTESSIMAPAHEGWTSFLIAIGILYRSRTKSRGVKLGQMMSIWEAEEEKKAIDRQLGASM